MKFIESYTTSIAFSSTDQNKDIDMNSVIDVLIENRTAGTVFIENYPLLTNTFLRESANSGEILSGSKPIDFNGQTGQVVVTIRRPTGKIIEILP